MRVHSLMVAQVVMMSSTRIIIPPASPPPLCSLECFIKGVLWKLLEEPNELRTLVSLSDLLRILTWLVVRRDLYRSGEYGRSRDDAIDLAKSSAWLYHLVKYLLTRWVGTVVTMTCHGWILICWIKSVVWMSVASLDHKILAIALPLPYLRRWTRCLMIRS